MKEYGCQPYGPAAFTHIFLLLIFVRDWVDLRVRVAAGRSMSMKNSNDTPEIEPVIFRLVA